MRTYRGIILDDVEGNANYRTALGSILNHGAHLKLKFNQNIRKRSIEDIFTEMKKKFFNGKDIGSACSLVGPAIKHHIDNYNSVGIDKTVIPEINHPTRAIMLRNPFYLANKNTIKIVNEDFFNAIFSHTIRANPGSNYIWSDIDYDGTAHYTSCRTTLIQFLSLLHKHRKSIVTKKFTIVTSFSRRGAARSASLYNDFEKNIMAYLFSLTGFRVHEIHYIDYSGIGPMTTVIFLLEKRFFSSTPPIPNYYTYLGKKSHATLKAQIQKNSLYI